MSELTIFIIKHSQCGVHHGLCKSGGDASCPRALPQGVQSARDLHAHLCGTLPAAASCYQRPLAGLGRCLQCARSAYDTRILGTPESFLSRKWIFLTNEGWGSWGWSQKKTEVFGLLSGQTGEASSLHVDTGYIWGPTSNGGEKHVSGHEDTQYRTWKCSATVTLQVLCPLCKTLSWIQNYPTLLAALIVGLKR